MKRLLGLAMALLPVATQAAPPARTGMVEVEPGISLHYETIGAGRNVVIVPGGFLLARDLRVLARPDRTLIFYDMRNRGRSSRVAADDKISIEADVADLEAIRRRFGARKASLIGYSYLGLMTMLYTAQNPERVARVVQLGPVPIKYDTIFPTDLVWSDPTPVISAEVAAPILKLRDEGFDRSDPKQYCLRYEAVARRRLVVDPALAERIDYRARCEMENEWPVNFDRHLGIHFTRSVQKLDPPRDAFRRLRTPVLTIHGTMDRNAPFAGGVEWVTTLPNARLVVAPRAAHSLWLDYPRALRDVDIFLGGAWPAGAERVRNWDEARRLKERRLQ